MILVSMLLILIFAFSGVNNTSSVEDSEEEVTTVLLRIFLSFKININNNDITIFFNSTASLQSGLSFGRSTVRTFVRLMLEGAAACRPCSASSKLNFSNIYIDLAHSVAQNFQSVANFDPAHSVAAVTQHKSLKKSPSLKIFRELCDQCVEP